MQPVSSTGRAKDPVCFVNLNNSQDTNPIVSLKIKCLVFGSLLLAEIAYAQSSCIQVQNMWGFRGLLLAGVPPCLLARPPITYSLYQSHDHVIQFQY